MQRRERKATHRVASVGRGRAGRIQRGDGVMRYMLVMQLFQKAIDVPHEYRETFRFIVLIDSGNGVALSWFEDKILLCNDRAALMRHSSTWLPARDTRLSTWVNELVSSRALALVRTLYSLPFLPSLDFAYRFLLFSQRQSRTAASTQVAR
jgi:hypothetical protein